MAILKQRMTAIAVLIGIELLAIVIAYQFFIDFECRSTASLTTCRLLRSLVARAVVVFAALGLFVWARPGAFAVFLRAIQANTAALRWRTLHLAGVALLFGPLLALDARDPGRMFQLALGPWIIGALAAGVGALLWLAPVAAWRSWLRAEHLAPLAVLTAAFLVPDLADAVAPLWDWRALTALTFNAVQTLLQTLGQEPFSRPQDYVIGIGDFAVVIAGQCSGVEGFALVGAFLGLYAALFRHQIRFGRFWLLVVPFGLMMSWLFNVLRIAGLILIGAHVSPDLAVNGFHSYAGWLFFTLLALAILYLVQAASWLRKDGTAAPGLPLRDDPVAACILPFVIFMLASVVVSALSVVPDLGYPLKALALAAVAGFFARLYRALPWSRDPVAVVAGLVVGLGWVVLAPNAGGANPGLMPALAALGPGAVFIWMAARLIGTVLLVPLVEELFFRGYVLAQADFGGKTGRVFAIAVSSLLFAALHGRWLAAGLAGIAFALVMLRRGRVMDAVIAHAVANFVVAIWAVTRGDWSLI